MIAKERCGRSTSSVAWRAIPRELLGALRRMWRRPALSLLVVATLAVGIGLTSCIFDVVNAILFKTPPIPDLGRLFTIHPSDRAPQSTGDMEFSDFEQLSDKASGLLDGSAAVAGWSGAVRGPDSVEQLTGELVSSRYFAVLHLSAEAGRLSVADRDSAPQPYAVISDALWSRWFHRSPMAIGQGLRVLGDVVTIAGVAPQDFRGVIMPSLRKADLWMPLGVSASIDPYRFLPEITSPLVRVFARLRPAQGMAEAQGSVQALGRTIVPSIARQRSAEAHGVRAQTFDGPTTLVLAPFVSSLMPAEMLQLVEHFGASLLALSVLVLLIACVNLAGALLAEMFDRQQEFSTRLALGARRADLIRLVFCETGLLVTTGFAGGLIFTRVFAAMVSSGVLPYLSRVDVVIDPRSDWRVILFSTLMALGAGAVAGLGPVWYAILGDRYGGSLDRRRVSTMKAQTWLLALEIAASAALVACATVYVRSAVAMLRHDPGFDGQHAALLRIDAGRSGLDERHGRALVHEIVSSVKSLPGVVRVAEADALPFGHGQRASLVADDGRGGQRTSIVGHFARVSPDYFELLHIPVVIGRSFLAFDRQGAPAVAVVSDLTAAALWPGLNPIGRRIAFFGEANGWREVIGVVRDTDIGAPGLRMPAAFVPIDQEYSDSTMVLVETRLNPVEYGTVLRQVVHNVSGGTVLSDISTVAADQAKASSAARLAAGALAGFGLVAMGLVTLGLYGLSSQMVQTQARAIGIRLALGASPGEIRRGVRAQAARLLISGLGLGLTVAYLGVPFLERDLFETAPHDAVSFAIVPILLTLVGFWATAVPARRAARVDPAALLRHQ